MMSHRDKKNFAIFAVTHMLDPKQNKLKQNEEMAPEPLG